MLIAFIILRIARGGGGDADLSGAVATIATTADGVIALWTIVVALISHALWRLAELFNGLHPAEGPHGIPPPEAWVTGSKHSACFWFNAAWL
jgi:Domain of Unknown Function (DUF1206)